MIDLPQLHFVHTFNDQNAVAMAIAGSRSQHSSSHATERSALPSSFVPGPNDVVCARGKLASKHAGNVEFVKVVQSRVQQYSAAKTKMEKSLIVSTVVDQIRENSPHGGFVKLNKADNVWYEVGDSLAREKVGQCFRDLLHTKYRSSSQSKQERRRRGLGAQKSVRPS